MFVTMLTPMTRYDSESRANLEIIILFLLYNFIFLYYLSK